MTLDAEAAGLLREAMQWANSVGALNGDHNEADEYCERVRAYLSRSVESPKEPHYPHDWETIGVRHIKCRVCGCEIQALGKAESGQAGEREEAIQLSRAPSNLAGEKPAVASPASPAWRDRTDLDPDEAYTLAMAEAKAGGITDHEEAHQFALCDVWNAAIREARAPVPASPAASPEPLTMKYEVMPSGSPDNGGAVVPEGRDSVINAHGAASQREEKQAWWSYICAGCGGFATTNDESLESGAVMGPCEECGDKTIVALMTPEQYSAWASRGVRLGGDGEGKK